MNNDDKEIRPDNEPDEERKSNTPLGNNEVKTTASSVKNDSEGSTSNENLDNAKPVDEGNVDNATTEGIP